MASLKRAVKKVSQIKTGYYQPENSKEFLSTLGHLLKIILPLEAVVVHQGTMQLIANGHYLQLAIDQGLEEIEVVLADFPEEDLIHAVVTHWKPSKKFAKMFGFIAILMKYYSKKNGQGAKYREEMSDLTLRELVAEFLGTNKTYLDWIEAVGKFNLSLLELVDKGELSLKEAFAMVPSSKTNGGKPGGGGGGSQLKNYTVPVTDTNALSSEELETLTANLPSKYSEQIANAVLPQGLSIAKSFTYDDTFQGFNIAYESEAKSVTTNIIYTQQLTSLLKAA